MRTSRLLENSILCKLSGFLSDLRNQNLIIIHCCDCFINKKNGRTTPLGFAAHQTVTFLRLTTGWRISHELTVSGMRLFPVLANLETFNIHSSEKQSFVRKRTQTTGCRYRIGKWQLFEHNLINVTDVLFLFCTKICEVAFLVCSVWWSRESRNIQLLSSRNVLGAGRSRD